MTKEDISKFEKKCREDKVLAKWIVVNGCMVLYKRSLQKIQNYESHNYIWHRRECKTREN